MAFDFTNYRVGGAMRPDSMSGMQPAFLAALEAMFAGAPPEIQQNLRVGSGYRSPQRQAQLWAGALQKYGSPAAARKWVAPPGRSQHGHGNAADLKFLSDQARQWVHQNAGQHGLAFPLANENWHIELAGARGGGHQHASAPAAAQPGPTVQRSAMRQQAAMQGPTRSLAAAYGSLPPQSPGFGGGLMPATPTGPEQMLTGLASLFVQQNQQNQRAQEEEASAEQARRIALFSEPSPFG
jgi:hypothetical protein